MKQEYTISQIAEKLHITTNKIRFYERKDFDSDESRRIVSKFGEEDISVLETTILLYRSIGIDVKPFRIYYNAIRKLSDTYAKPMDVINNEIHRLSEIRKSLKWFGQNI